MTQDIHARKLAAVTLPAPSNPLETTPAEHWPVYADDEINGVVQTLRSGRVNQWNGDRVFALEQSYADYVGTGQAIALANGSLALELALRAFDIGPGDEVVVAPRTFVASAFCVALVGATPVFADVDRESGNVTAETLAAAVTSRTRALVPVHLGGWPADMPGICALARERDLLVVEDCAQAHGAEIAGRPVGSFGDASAFSFCRDKIISTGGEGGLALFRDEDAYEWAWSFKDHGKSRAKVFAQQAEPGFRWLHDSVGTNWRMLETSAVIGLAQLAKLDEWRATRARNADIWMDALSGIPGLRVPTINPGDMHAWYRLYCYVDRGGDNARLRDEILRQTGALGVRVFSGSCSEVYLEQAFAGEDLERLPVARELGDASLAFEVHPTLDPERLAARASAVAAVVRSVLS